MSRMIAAPYVASLLLAIFRELVASIGNKGEKAAVNRSAK